MGFSNTSKAQRVFELLVVRLPSRLAPAAWEAAGLGVVRPCSGGVTAVTPGVTNYDIVSKSHNTNNTSRANKRGKGRVGINTRQEDGGQKNELIE